MAVFLKWPISVARPSEVDLGAVCWRLAPAVPAEFISGHNYQWQSLREEVVSLTDRQQNTVDRTMEDWSHFTERKRTRCHAGPRHKIHSVLSEAPKDFAWDPKCSCRYKLRFQTDSSWLITYVHVVQDFSLPEKIEKLLKSFQIKTHYPSKAKRHPAILLSFLY